jgi:RNA polymerase sigma-70 factor (ECF subfamily)
MSHAQNPDDLNSRPDKQYSYQETVRAIDSFLRDSDDINRRVYMMMDVEGMEKEEVAEQLDLTIPALKARLHRIRYALREHLSQPA